jgi:hypothetical protein
MASIEKIEAFLAERRNVVVGGVRKDGRPHHLSAPGEAGQPAS